MRAACRRCHRKEDRTFNQGGFRPGLPLHRNAQLVRGLAAEPRVAYAAFRAAYFPKIVANYVNTRQIPAGRARAATAAGLLIRCRTRASASLENNLANSSERAFARGPLTRPAARSSINRIIEPCARFKTLNSSRERDRSDPGESLYISLKRARRPVVAAPIRRQQFSVSHLLAD